MNKTLLGKAIFIIVVLIIFVVGVLLGNPSDWGKNFGILRQEGLKAAIQQNISLGLDLKGGTHLILQVHVNEAVNAETDRAIESLKEQLRAKSIAYADITKPDPVNAPQRLLLKGIPPESAGDLRSIVQDRLSDYDLTSGPENSWVLAMKPSKVEDLKKHAVAQAIETIRNRIDQLGVSEPVIEEHGLGQYQILVQLPGIDDPARVKQIMQSTAMLEIRQAIDKQPYPSEQAALQAHQGVLPPDSVLLPEGNLMKRRSTSTQETSDQYWVISRTAAVSGNDLRDAQMTRDENNRPAIGFTLTADGGRRFANFTGSHVNDSLAIVLDRKVQSVANIQEQIHDQGRITGNFSEQEAKDLAMVLRSGALPASIGYLQEETVGPSLGADSIRHGVIAAVVGMLAVMVFMLVYYRGAGINADLALILNLIILLGFLGFSGATLTLPGIAGVILTVGMGVDSNVLIFERIREELRNGKTAPSAVEQGFGRAWITIVDTHVTTIVSAFILFIFGTGPVKGFAVTLTFGLLANLFTAVFVSRVIFDAHLNNLKRGEALSI
jgi:preprotein translocase subunit SecD